MPKIKIAERREREVIRLAEYAEGGATEENIAIARRLMNSFYRLSALDERNCEYANDERTCNCKWLARDEERALKWADRLKKEIEKFAGLTLFYCGCYPSIGTRDANGGVSEKIQRWYYSRNYH